MRRVGRVGRRARAGRAPHAELAHRVGGGRVGGEPLGRRLDRVDAHRHRGRRGCPALAAALRAAAPALPPGQPPAERRRAPPLPRTAGAGRADALCARLTSSNRRRGPATVKQQPSPGARDGCRARSLCRKRPKRRCGRDQMVRTLRAGRSGPRSSAATPPNREMVFRMPAFFVRCVSLTHEGCREWCLARSACLRAFEKSICGGSCGGFVRFRRLRGVCVLQLIYRVTTRAVPFLKLGPGTSDVAAFIAASVLQLLPPTRRAASTARLTRLLLSSDLLHVAAWVAVGLCLGSGFALVVGGLLQWLQAGSFARLRESRAARAHALVGAREKGRTRGSTLAGGTTRVHSSPAAPSDPEQR